MCPTPTPLPRSSLCSKPSSSCSFSTTFSPSLPPSLSPVIKSGFQVHLPLTSSSCPPRRDPYKMWRGGREGGERGGRRGLRALAEEGQPSTGRFTRRTTVFATIFPTCWWERGVYCYPAPCIVIIIDFPPALIFLCNCRLQIA